MPDLASDLRPGVLEAQLELAILALLAERDSGKTICPSEAAKMVAAVCASASATQRTRDPLSPDGKLDRKPDRKPDWRPLMAPARAAARRLVELGRIVITQKGRIVDPATAKGPIRLRLR
jgi:hypothetical protein